MSSPPFRSLNLSTWVIRSQTGFCKIRLNVWMKTDKSGTWARFSSTTIPPGSANWYTLRIAGSYDGKDWKINRVIFSYLPISVRWVIELLTRGCNITVTGSLIAKCLDRDAFWPQFVPIWICEYFPIYNYKKVWQNGTHWDQKVSRTKTFFNIKYLTSYIWFW